MGQDSQLPLESRKFALTRMVYRHEPKDWLALLRRRKLCLKATFRVNPRPTPTHPTKSARFLERHCDLRRSACASVNQAAVDGTPAGVVSAYRERRPDGLYGFVKSTRDYPSFDGGLCHDRYSAAVARTQPLPRDASSDALESPPDRPAA